MAKRAPRGGPALAGLTLLDLLGPQTALAAVMDVHLLWKTVDRPVVTDTGISIHPTMRLADCPQDLDVLFVPGGPGMVEVTRDREVLDFLADRGPGRLGDVGLQRVDRAGGGRIAGRLRATSAPGRPGPAARGRGRAGGRTGGHRPEPDHRRRGHRSLTARAPPVDRPAARAVRNGASWNAVMVVEHESAATAAVFLLHDHGRRMSRPGRCGRVRPCSRSTHTTRWSPDSCCGEVPRRGRRRRARTRRRRSGPITDALRGGLDPAADPPRVRGRPVARASSC